MSSRSHTLIVVVEDKPGVLNRITSVLRRRGFNIDSLKVQYEPEGVWITLGLRGAKSGIELLQKQIDRLVNVLKVIIK